MRFVVWLIFELVFCVTSLPSMAQRNCRELFVISPGLVGAIDVENLLEQKIIVSEGNTNLIEIYLKIQSQLQLHPEDPGLYYAKAKLFIATGDFRMAYQNIGRALELNRSDLIIRDLEVSILMRLGHYQEAVDKIRYLLANDPEGYHEWRTQRYQIESHIYMASTIEVAYQRIRLDPEDTSAWNLAAVAAYQMKDWGRADGLNQMALKTDDRDFSARSLRLELEVKGDSEPWTKFQWIARLKRLKVSVGTRPGLILTAYDKILEFEPRDNIYLAERALYLHESAMVYITTFSSNGMFRAESLQRVNRALEAVSEAINIGPATNSLLLAKSSLLTLLGSYGAALEVVDLLIKENPDADIFPAPFVKKARILELLGDAHNLQLLQVDLNKVRPRFKDLEPYRL